jgi:hypothetical protein
LIFAFMRNLTDFNLDLEVDGTFWAPFWSIFDMWYTPDDVARMDNSSLLTPLFVWIYLTITLVLVVNLLIAMFNKEFSKTMATADNTVRMQSCRQVGAYMVMYAVPPPFNLPALALQFLWWLLKQIVCCCNTKTKSGSHPESHQHEGGGGEGGNGGNRHYPDRMHLQDKVVEALVVQARDKYFFNQRKGSWYAAQRKIRRFDQIESKLERVLKVVERMPNAGGGGGGASGGGAIGGDHSKRSTATGPKEEAAPSAASRVTDDGSLTRAEGSGT